MAIYNHLYRRVDYPHERGYRIEPYKLPDWITVEIREDGDSKVVIVRSRWHVNKEVHLPVTYSLDWTDKNILHDVFFRVWDSFLR